MTDPTPDAAATVDPRDEAVLTEVAYRMQAEWPGGDVACRAVLTAAMLTREAITDRLRRQPWENALPIADAIEKDEWDV